MTEARLDVDSLDLWRGDAWLVRGLSFSAQRGQLVHVYGPNGAGKTTLLRALAGLVRPESGAVHWRGKPIAVDAHAYHSEIAWLGHRDALKPELTPHENLSIHARLAGGRAQAVGDALRDAGVEVAAGLQSRLLSTGQRRRAALARVFSSSAPLWILDEPLANLDAPGRDWALAHVEDHVGSGGIAVITSHLELQQERIVRIGLGEV